MDKFYARLPVGTPAPTPTLLGPSQRPKERAVEPMPPSSDEEPAPGRRVAFAPPSFDHADLWLTQLRAALPASAFERVRWGALQWNVFPSAREAHRVRVPRHPLSTMSAAEELAAAFLALASWQRAQRCQLASAIREAESSASAHPRARCASSLRFCWRAAPRARSSFNDRRSPCAARPGSL